MSSIHNLISTLVGDYHRLTGRDVTRIALGTLEHGELLAWIDAQDFTESSPDIRPLPGEVLYLGRRVSLMKGLPKGILLCSDGHFPIRKPDY